MSSLDLLLRETAQLLKDSGVPSPRVDATLLASHVLGLETSEVQLKALTGLELSTAQEESLKTLAAERARRIPLQHLTGTAAFRHLELKVGPGAFIPRPETEILVDAVLAHTAERGLHRPRLVDLGTGSGAIAAALAHESPQARVYAVELSAEAAAWAQLNFDRLPVGSAQVTLLECDLGDALGIAQVTGSVDVVVSNPPYIPQAMVPQEQEVREHDPQIALYGGGADGLQLPRAVIETAAQLLEPAGFLIMEHAEVQAEQLRTELEADPRFTQVQTHQDLTGRDRATSAVLTHSATSA